MRRRGQPDDQQPRIGIAPPRDRPSPVRLGAEFPLPDLGHHPAVRAKARAPLALDNRRSDIVERPVRHDTFRVFRFMKSMRMNCPSVIVFVK